MSAKNNKILNFFFEEDQRIQESQVIQKYIKENEIYAKADRRASFWSGFLVAFIVMIIFIGLFIEFIN